MKISNLLILTLLAIAPSAFGSHIFFSPVTGNTVALSTDSSNYTTLTGPVITFETTITGVAGDTITFDFSDENVPDFAFFFESTGPVSFNRTITDTAQQSVLVDISGSVPDFEVTGDGATFYFQVEAESGVPEPGSVALLGGGLVALVGWRKRRN